MKVRTIREHSNAHRPAGPKRHGRKYELSDSEGRMLIDAGLVEEDHAGTADVADDI